MTSPESSSAESQPERTDTELDEYTRIESLARHATVEAMNALDMTQFATPEDIEEALEGVSEGESSTLASFAQGAAFLLDEARARPSQAGKVLDLLQHPPSRIFLLSTLVREGLFDSLDDADDTSVLDSVISDAGLTRQESEYVHEQERMRRNTGCDFSDILVEPSSPDRLEVRDHYARITPVIGAKSLSEIRRLRAARDQRRAEGSMFPAMEHHFESEILVEQEKLRQELKMAGKTFLSAVLRRPEILEKATETLRREDSGIAAGLPSRVIVGEIVLLSEEGRLPIALVEQIMAEHLAYFEKLDVELRDRLPLFLSEFQVMMFWAIRKEGLPITPEEVERRLSGIRVEIADLASFGSGVGGDFDASTGLIRLSTVLWPDQLGHVIIHELLHAISGRTVVRPPQGTAPGPASKRFEARLGLSFSRPYARMDVADRRWTWLNEAVTEHLTQRLFRGGYTEEAIYLGERSALQRLFDEGLSPQLVYQAYFENRTPDTPAEERLVGWKGMLRALKEISPGEGAIKKLVRIGKEVASAKKQSSS